jgi:hypothetical protein
MDTDRVVKKRHAFLFRAVGARALLNLFVLFHKSYFPRHQAALLDLSGRNSTNFIAPAIMIRK